MIELSVGVLPSARRRKNARATRGQTATAHADMLAGKRVALATLWDGVPDYACAVMHYCQHAQRLADVFVKGLGADSADLLMMLTKDHMYEAKTTKACRCKKSGKRFCPECPRDESSLADLETARGIVKSDCPQMKLHTPTHGCARRRDGTR